MYDPYRLEDDGPGTVFRDVILLALAGFIIIVGILLPHINPPAVEKTFSINPPGNISVEITWPSYMDNDVDLWVQAPNDVPVGYSNNNGLFFNLLRDDRGHLGDVTEINHEVAFSRGIMAGEYVVNLHLYNNRAEIFPVPVDVVISVKSPVTKQTSQLLTSRANLRTLGEEITVFRFVLDDKGYMFPESVSALPKKLRNFREK